MPALVVRKAAALGAALAVLAACVEQGGGARVVPTHLQACVSAFTDEGSVEVDPVALDEQTARLVEACLCFAEVLPAEDFAFITPVFAIEQEEQAPAERARRVDAQVSQAGDLAAGRSRLEGIRTRVNNQCPFREAYPPEDENPQGLILDSTVPNAAPPAP